MSSKPIILYIDYLSQPSRAILAFCLLNKIPHEIKQIRIFKGEGRSEEFKKINPFGKVPAIDDNGFKLFESHAILHYLVRKFNTTEWYPQDIKKAALVDCYLDWHHTNTRRAAAYFLSIQKEKFSQLKINFNPEEEKKYLTYVLKMFENVWLKDRKYIASSDKPTIADLSACCELIQLELINFDFTPYPKLKEWKDRIMEIEEMNKAHSVFSKVKQMVLNSQNSSPKL